MKKWQRFVVGITLMMVVSGLSIIVGARFIYPFAINSFISFWMLWDII